MIRLKSEKRILNIVSKYDEFVDHNDLIEYPVLVIDYNLKL